MPLKLSLSCALFSFSLLVAGCSSNGNNASTQTATTVAAGVSLGSTGLSYASTAAGVTSADQTVTVTNNSSASVSITGIGISEPNQSVFLVDGGTCVVTPQTPMTLAAGASCTVTISFTPALASTAYTGILVVTDNVGGVAGSTQSLSLTGSSAPPVPVAQAVLSATSLTYTSALGMSAPVQTITLANPGTAALTGIAVTISGSSTFAIQVNTCGTTLAAGTNCMLLVSFTPIVAGTVSGTLSVADSASGSPQTVALNGAGAIPVVTLSASNIVFSATLLGTTSAASSVTVSNTGSAVLNLTSITLGGTNASSFTETNSCGTTLLAYATCSISVKFSPLAATAYTATVTLVDNATTTPQTITLSGSGTTSSVMHTLYTFPEADNSVTPLYALVNGATKTIDMTMYALEDTVFSGDLVAACKRGVVVRVILDQNLEKSGNTAAYNQLNAQTNCSAVWANKAFQATHEKCITVDGTTTAIMSLNLQSGYYSTTRDFALVENDAADIASIEAAFTFDYAAGTPVSGVAGASDFGYAPTAGDNDLIWSPTTAQPDLLALINGAKTTLLVENEEMGAANIVSALEAACLRGVSVHIAMVSQSSYAANFSALEAAGCGVHVYPDTTNGFYIHAKAMVADYGLSTQSVYMGSINFSIASMTENRELGAYITDAPSVLSLYMTMTSDYAGGTAY